MPPELIETPDRFLRVIGKSDASIPCQAFGFPPPKTVWSRGFLSLPQGRTSVTNGTLTISNFSPQDAGIYQCKATNKLGSVSALTTLNYVPPGENQEININRLESYSNNINLEQNASKNEVNGSLITTDVSHS